MQGSEIPVTGGYRMHVRGLIDTPIWVEGDAERRLALSGIAEESTSAGLLLGVEQKLSFLPAGVAVRQPETHPGH